jgi:two-component system, OmpR family, sensor histidine kinase ArlS
MVKTYLRNIFGNLRKNFKLSISFKISMTYMGLYLLSIVIVVFSAMVGYFIYQTIGLDRTGEFYAGVITQKTIREKEVISEYLIDERLNGVTIYDSKFDQILNTQSQLDVYVNNVFYKFESVLREEVYVYSTSVFENNQMYYVNIYFDASRIIDEVTMIGLFVSGAGLLGLMIMVAVGPVASRKLVQPISDMTEVAKTISANNINTRLNVKASQHELKELAETFNHMMDRIEDDYIKQQQFVSDASHELRTPIAVLRGYVDMLDRWGKNDKEILEESIQAIKNEAGNMQDLVEKLLFIARNDKKTLKLTKEEFNINEVMDEVFKETKMIDTTHEINNATCEDVIVFADKNRIKQAIRIFVENAIKFTPSGGKIDIFCDIKGEFVSINVKDSGIGIRSKDLKKIFNRFYRAEVSRDKESGGHGLGLSIAKIIILGHRGKINVKSQYGEGSTFSIMLPYIKILPKAKIVNE